MQQAVADDAPTEGIGTVADAPRVFISYSHDSDAHTRRVLDLANALRRDGIDTILDQYLHRGPEEGWPLWMDRNIRDADFVLMVCTATYLRRVMSEEKAGKGLGVRWEGKLIYNRIYHGKPSGSRFIPILLPGSEPAYIPTPVLGHNRYEITSFNRADSGYDGLYRHLMDKPKVIAPELGTPLGEPVVWNVPYPRNPNFTGREAILTQLETALASGMPVALSQAITGLGGVGKTQTAVEHAYRHRDRYRAVLWVRADTETSLISGYRALAEVLDLPEKDESDSTKVAATVRRWLGREPGYLLILDNADDPALVKPYLPPDLGGHVLLTSRAHNFDRLNIRRPIALPVLAPDEALAFLLRRTDREEAIDPAERDAARTLAEELGYLPLALEQAAAYMVEHEESFSVYLAAYYALRLKLLDEMGPIAGDYPETVRTTWKRGFDAIAATSPASIVLLRLSAFFAPDAIPYEVILEGASQLGEPLATALASPAGGDHALNKLLTPLARHSLVRRDPEARTYSVHRLVQAVLLDELTAADRRDIAERVVKVLIQAFPNSVEYASWPQCERLLPHVLATWSLIEREVVSDPILGWLLNQAGIYHKSIPILGRLLNSAGYYLKCRARYAEAEPLLRRALAIHEKLYSPEHPDTAANLNNLALLLQDRGQYDEAEPLLRRALAIHEQAPGPEHPITAQSLSNLALLLQDRGRYDEAEPLLRRALAIHEQAPGPEHPITATSLNNLAIVLRSKGRYDEAESLTRRVLAIREQALGPEHPDTAQSLNNLAALLWNQGRYDEAESLTRRALAIREQALGPEHPDTAQSLSNLGALLWNQDRYDEAESLLRRALAIHEQALGPEHPVTAQSLSNLALLLQDRGRYDEAEPLLRRSLAICEQALGPEHPVTAQNRNSLVTLLWNQGRAAEALRLARGVIGIGPNGIISP